MSRDEVRTYSTDGEIKPPSVLVVDDDPLIVALLTGLLTSKNYTVIKSYSGQEALKVVQTQHVDLIICDVAMPSMSGYDFLTLIRKERNGAQIPVVFLTPSGAVDDRKAKHEHGVAHCIPKPLDPQMLLSAVRESIGRQVLSEMLTKRDFDAYRKRVVHTLSHEFRTPLSAINVGIELLMEHRQSLDSEKATNVLEAVRRGGIRLEKLVRDFLILQQMEAGITNQVFASHASAVTVSEIVEHYMHFKAPSHIDEGASFTVSVDTGVSRVHVVECNILDCLDRLVSNAVKFSEHSKQVEIEVSIDCREARLSVKDRGCGIDLAKVDSAFELFRQIDRESKEQQGGGMGLPIARGYASAHKGRLEFRAREGGGAIVTLVLPLVDEASVAKIDPLMREH
jgi:two-component system sensor histidine kinase/response regulator